MGDKEFKRTLGLDVLFKLTRKNESGISKILEEKKIDRIDEILTQKPEGNYQTSDIDTLNDAITKTIQDYGIQLKCSGKHQD